MKLNFSRLATTSPDLLLPTRATLRSAGYDLYCPTSVALDPGEQKCIPLGVAWNPEQWSVEVSAFNETLGDFGTLQMGFFAKIFDKSGLAVKKRFNTRAGVIDMDYLEPWGLICVNESDQCIWFEKNHKIAQFVLLPFMVASDLRTEDQVREGGYGSTGV